MNALRKKCNQNSSTHPWSHIMVWYVTQLHLWSYFDMAPSYKVAPFSKTA